MQMESPGVDQFRRLCQRLSGQMVCNSLMILAVLPLIYLCFFAHPSPVDDYYNSGWTNFFSAQREVYMTNNGRFLSTVITSLNPMHWHSIAGYRLAIASIVLVYGWSFAAIVSRLTERAAGLPHGTGRLVGMLLLMLLLNNLHSLTEAFYWFTGAATYSLSMPLIAGMVYCAPGLMHQGDRWKNTCFAILAVALPGFNEVAMSAAGLIIVLSLWTILSQRRARAFRQSAMILLGFVLSVAIVLSSPGAWMRHGAFHVSFGGMLVTWPVEAGRLVLQWMTDPWLLVGAGLVVWHLSRTTFYQSKNLLAYAALPLLTVLVLTAIPFLGMGSLPPRVLNMVYCCFLLSLLPLLVSLAGFCREITSVLPRTLAVHSKELVAIVMILAIGFTVPAHNLRAANFFQVLRDVYRGSPQEFDSAVKRRYQFLAHHPVGDTLRLAPLDIANDNLLFYGDIRQDAANMRNRSYARFWGKTAVTLGP